jgi:hypothetical protein
LDQYILDEFQWGSKPQQPWHWNILPLFSAWHDICKCHFLKSIEHCTLGCLSLRSPF